MTVTIRNLTLVCAALAMALAVTPAGPSRSSGRATRMFATWSQQAARLVASGQAAALTTAQQGGQTTAPASGPKMALTLDDAVKLALDRNLDIAVQRLNPQISDLAYRERPFDLLPDPDVHHRDPVDHATRRPTPFTGGTIGSGVTNGTGMFNGGIAQSLPWGGGSYAVTLNNPRATSTAAISRYNPAYSPIWSASIPSPCFGASRPTRPVSSCRSPS